MGCRPSQMEDSLEKLEELDVWPSILAVKDVMGIREIAKKFNLMPGTVSSAFIRTGTTRIPQRAPEPLPAEKGGVSPSRSAQNGAGNGPPKSRRRQSRVDAYADLLGKVPDRVIAEKAKVSVQAVRNRRVRLGIPSSRAYGAMQYAELGNKQAGVTGVTPPIHRTLPVDGAKAWKVELRSGEVAFVVGDSIAAAAQATGSHNVIKLELAGPMLINTPAKQVSQNAGDSEPSRGGANGQSH